MHDVSADHGRLRPSAFFAWAIAQAQQAPHNWLGQQLAQLMRRLVLAWAPLPLDVAVGPVRMRCHLRDNNSEKKFVFMPWRFDAPERQWLTDVLPRDGVFVDIGANVGIYSLAAATHLGARGRILALEPNPPAFERLRFNLAATRAGQADWPVVHTLRLGVGDVAGEFDLHLDPANLGGSSIAPQAGGALDSGAVQRIHCQPLLAILAVQRVSHIDVLKIDIEGAEDLALMPFLASAPDSLLPRHLIIENSEHLWRQDLVGALRGRGYTPQLRTRMNCIYALAPATPAASP